MNITQTHIDRTVATLISQFEHTVSRIPSTAFRPHDDLFREWYGVRQGLLALQLLVLDYYDFDDSISQIERIYQSHVERTTEAQVVKFEREAFQEPAKTDTGLYPDLQAGSLGQDQPSPPEASALGQGGAFSVRTIDVIGRHKMLCMLHLTDLYPNFRALRTRLNQSRAGGSK